VPGFVGEAGDVERLAPPRAHRGRDGGVRHHPAQAVGGRPAQRLGLPRPRLARHHDRDRRAAVDHLRARVVAPRERQQHPHGAPAQRALLERRGRVGVVRSERQHPRRTLDASPTPRVPATVPQRLGRREAGAEELLQQVGAPAPPRLRHRPLAHELERQHGGPVLQRAPAPRRPRPVGRAGRQPAQELPLGPHRQHRQAPAAGRALVDVQPRRQAGVGARQPLAALVVERHRGARVAGDGRADRVGAGAGERQLAEAAQQVLRAPQLGEPLLQPALDGAALDGARHLRRDGGQEGHLVAAEVALPLALDVQHADQPSARHHGHRAHRDEPLLVDPLDPREARLGADVGHGEGGALAGGPAGDALADAQAGAADGGLGEAVGGGQHQVVAALVREVDRADLGRHRLGRLRDDQAHEVLRLQGGGGGERQAVEEALLQECIHGGGPPVDGWPAAHRPGDGRRARAVPRRTRTH
jgi:hypothetical protein